MKKFLLIIVPFCVICLGSMYLCFYAAPPWADSYYGKISGEAKNSLILGSSRAAQGLVPSIMNEELERVDLYNFAFSHKHSPYGDIYFELVKKKVTKTSQNSIFIVEVQPWTLSSANHKRLENFESIREEYHGLANVKDPTLRPNLSYLWNSYNFHYGYMFMKKPKSFLHDDGWLEINTGLDSLTEARAIKKKYKASINEMNRLTTSEFRWESLEQTIRFLGERGQVYLVRLPIPELMVNYEDNKWPEFDTRIKELADLLNVDYINLRGIYPQMRFTDLNHLHAESSRLISRILSDSIVSYQNNTDIP